METTKENALTGASGSLARGDQLSPETFTDFVERLKYHCRGEGVNWHCTASALFTVQAKRIVGGLDMDYVDDRMIVVDDCEYLSLDDYWNNLDEDQKKALDDIAIDLHDEEFRLLPARDQYELLADRPEHTVTGYCERWEHVNSHFTKEAAEAFIRRKSHDYRHGLRVYVDAQLYCWEFEAIKNALMDGQLVLHSAALQPRVEPWLLECFGPEIAADRVERNHRFLEEALELVQSTGCTAEEAHKLVDYVFGRPAGEPVQEVGGVMITLAALCLANDLDMHSAGEAELARISQPEMIVKIRDKQMRKPAMSPLPGVYPERQQHLPTQLLPCPFCGSSRTRHDETMFSGDDGEHPGVECLDCDCINSLANWNKRAQQAAALDNQKLVRNLRESLDVQDRTLDHLREQLKKASDYREYLRNPEESPVWIWQGDGEDHPESMVNSLTVVIRADQLKALMSAAGPQPAVPDFSEWDSRWPDYARRDGMVRIPVSELQRWRNVMASNAHPHESPHAKDIDALLSAAKRVES